MVVHGNGRGIVPWKAAPVRLPSPVPSACFASISLRLREPWLAAPRAARSSDGPRTLRASQNPMRLRNCPTGAPIISPIDEMGRW
jgi:hypothetical protein